MAEAPFPADPAAWALFLDVDGTLLDLQAVPDAVVVPAALHTRMASLRHRLSGALALVSGRSLTDIDRLFPDFPDVAGTHGAEWRMAGRPVLAAAALPEAALAMIEDAARALPGVLVERKAASVALHFALAPEQAAAVQALARSALRALGPSYRLQGGKAVVELTPADVGKGAAIERFMGRVPYAGRTPVFVGDDLTDEDGFHAVHRLGGISIHVGDGPSAARHRLASPDAVRGWLAALDDRLGDTHEHA